MGCSKHFFRYLGYDASNWLDMFFKCEKCDLIEHVHRGTWNFLTKGRK